MADAMAAALGFPGYRYALVTHPVGSLGREEVRTLARAAAAQVLALLQGAAPPGGAP